MDMHVDAAAFAEELAKVANFFAGVPDSLLKPLCAALGRTLPARHFWTTANEGAAVALSAGYTLATGLPGAVYMQNSGLGHAINPLLSLNDVMVYGIPVLLLVGWRGEPGIADEPQHKKQGIVTTALLDVCRIPYTVLPPDGREALNTLTWAKNTMDATSAPVALLVRKGLFSPLEYPPRPHLSSYKREAALEDIVSCLAKEHLVVSTTGMISRELYEIRARRNESGARDLLIVGAMGHVSQIALGLALGQPGKRVVCLDGDGSALMHMGSMATVGRAEAPNMFHIMLNNAAHDSVGGHPSGAEKIDWTSLALACGYECAASASDPEHTKSLVQDFLKTDACCFLEVKVARGARNDLGRPGESPAHMKRNFRHALEEKTHG